LLPIPGESLPGFLLRLSCRLQLAPARLVEVTGLALAGHSGTRSPAILLAGIPAPASQAFTRMTRLTADKVTQLGLVTWKGRYPLPAGAPKDVTAALPPLDSRSVFAPATRYCPDCLTGEGSAIQESFGGPWRKTWHLPVVFACPLHQRLLEHRCPECDQIVRGRRPAGSSRGAFGKLATYAIQAPERLPLEATNLLIANAINLVVFIHHDRRTGQRTVASVREVTGAEGPLVTSNEVFTPGPGRRAVPAAPLRAETLDVLVEAGFDPGLLERREGWWDTTAPRRDGDGQVVA
jgi:hypothetical protein